jgi:hypothetical protein
VSFLTDTDQVGRVDPMALIFPKTTTCAYWSYGASGTLTNLDSLCILSINLLNEKIYFIMFFWFLTLAVLTFLQIVIRIIIILIPRKRETLLKNQAHVSFEVASIIVKELSYDQWFTVYMMGKNMESSFFSLFIEELAKKITEDTISL